jgi:uncharacterized membrane protein YkvI
MIAGSGATFNQHFGISIWFGTGLMSICSIAAVFLGLHKIFDGIGAIGPIIIVMSIFTGAVILILYPLDIAHYEAFIANADMYKAADNWFMSTILYVLWGIVMGLPFMSAMGSQAVNVREVIHGTIFGNLIFNMALACISYAMASRIDWVYDMSIPSLAMASSIHPAFGTAYSVMIIIAIFTTAVPLLWTVASRIAPEKTKVHNISIVIIGILGFFGGQLPFELLINYFYPLIGYLGFIVLAAIIWRDIKRIKNRKGSAEIQ